MPVLSFPSVRVNLESCICQLEGQESGDLQVRIQFPNDFEENYLIMMFKFRTAMDVLVGPSLMVFVKIIATDMNEDVRPSEAELIVQGQ